MNRSSGAFSLGTTDEQVCALGERKWATNSGRGPRLGFPGQAGRAVDDPDDQGGIRIICRIMRHYITNNAIMRQIRDSDNMTVIYNMTII